MQSLYDIEGDLIALWDLLAETGGDVSTPDVESTIDEWFASINNDLRTKVDGYCCLISEIESRAAARLTESTRLRQLANIDSRSAKGLRDRLHGFMERSGTKRLDTNRYRVTVAQNGGKRPLLVNDDVDPELWKDFAVQPPPEIDLAALREHLDSGNVLEWARLGDRGSHLRIA